ncbi:MAG: DUF4340 domain-containing protein [Negativicutes bacterium]|nr:DUF4340 domain-containing protein [Negativicutes bacterium]
MRNRNRRLLLLLLLLISLVGCYVFVGYLSTKNANKIEAAKTIALLPDLPAEDISRLMWTYKGETVTLRKANQTWQAADDAALAIDQSYPAAMVAALTSLTASRQLSGSELTGEYGLTAPSYVYVITTKDQREIVLTVGDRSSVNSDYYLSISGRDFVYLVNDTLISAFLYNLADLTAAAVTTP